MNDSTGGLAVEMLSRRCVALLRTTLRPDMWPNAELHLQWLDKLLLTAENGQQVRSKFAYSTRGIYDIANLEVQIYILF